MFVTDYPKEIKSFYMKQNPDGKTVAPADMLVPGIGELIGGDQREENYDKLVARMDELGMDKTNYDWYLNLRKFGGVEHAGYGLGFERMIMYLTGIQNIRDVLPFPAPLTVSDSENDWKLPPRCSGNDSGRIILNSAIPESLRTFRDCIFTGKVGAASGRFCYSAVAAGWDSICEKVFGAARRPRQTRL